MRRVGIQSRLEKGKTKVKQVEKKVISKLELIHITYRLKTLRNKNIRHHKLKRLLKRKSTNHPEPTHSGR